MPKSLKWILILAAVGFGLKVISGAIGVSREVDVLVAFEKSCAQQATESGRIPPDQAAAVCDCTQTKATEKFGSSGFAQLLQQGMGAPEADRTALTAIMLTCMDTGAKG